MDSLGLSDQEQDIIGQWWRDLDELQREYSSGDVTARIAATHNLPHDDALALIRLMMDEHNERRRAIYDAAQAALDAVAPVPA
jgi:hypothetical protein